MNFTLTTSSKESKTFFSCNQLMAPEYAKHDFDHSHHPTYYSKNCYAQQTLWNS